MIAIALLVGVLAGVVMGIVAIRGQRANRRAGLPDPEPRQASHAAIRGYFLGRAIARNRVPQHYANRAAWRGIRKL